MMTMKLFFLLYQKKYNIEKKGKKILPLFISGYIIQQKMTNSNIQLF